MSCRPIYRRTPATKISRLGPKITDDVTGFLFHQRYKIVQYGQTKDGRDRNSVDIDYGMGYTPGIDLEHPQ